MSGRKKRVVKKVATKEPPKIDQPKAVKPNPDADLNDIGILPITTVKDAPKIQSKKMDGETGKETTVFDMGAIATPVTIDTRQPFLTEKEVEKIGVYKWHEYKSNSEIFTTVVNGRRFKLKRSIFEGLKDRGLVIQDG